MKLYHILSILLLAIGAFALTGCSGEDDSMNSSARLLPSKVSAQYRASAKRIYSYKYDESNRMTEYKETRYYGNDISLQDIETTCKIIYGGNNRIDTMIIIPRLINIDTTLADMLYELVNDTITFDYKADTIIAKRKNKTNEEIVVDSQGYVYSHQYVIEGDLTKQVKVDYQYDNNGNIQKYIVNSEDEAEAPYMYYTYDSRNGIFRNVNTPQWFLVIMINQEFNFLNNYKEYVDNKGNKWGIEYKYNSDDYPVYFRSQYGGEGHILVDEAPYTVEYILAN